MFAHSGHVMTLANSIIGVGILAMPFCFEKCGIILAILLLIISNWITRICCHYLIKISLLTRRKSFEFLGFHAFGSSGKLLAELCIIGYLVGTCITYFVVIGDLGPQIVTKMFNLNEAHKHLRTLIMLIVTLVCILPLGMLKNVDSLSTICTASIGFYVCLVIKIILESATHIGAHDWTDKVVYWEPAGVLQCLPIISMALSCQMQIFEVFSTINNQSLEKLNGIVRHATWICTLVYIAVGFFGYVAFCTQKFSGNILVNLAPSFSSDVIKIGFVLSVAFSFPLVIFPCRASIYSLLYRKGQTDATMYIPEQRFKTITTFIVGFALCIALIIPSVELIIGLVGSTIGVAICIMFPAASFRKIILKNTTERNFAQLVLVCGFCLMILGTYANLNAIDEKSSGVHIDELSANNYQLKATELPLQNQVYDRKNKLQEIEYSANPILEIKILKNQQQKFKEENEKKLMNTFVKPSVFSTVLPVKIIDKANVDYKPKIVSKNIDNKIDLKSAISDRENIQISEVKPIEAKSNVLNVYKTNDTNNLKLQPGNEALFTAQQTIDKDAIKTNEEIAAEEQKDNKINDEELNETKKELKQTKELFERTVDELKEELAKQNQETQNLVVEKINQMVEKVEQIEKKVQLNEEKLEEQDKGIDNVNNVADRQLNKNDEIREIAYKMEPIHEDVNKIKNNGLLQVAVKQQGDDNSQIQKETKMVKVQKADENIVYAVEQNKAPLPNKLDKALTNNINESPKLRSEEAEAHAGVYEPHSYKAGEMHANDNAQPEHLPPPLALLFNVSQTKFNESLQQKVNKNNPLPAPKPVAYEPASPSASTANNKPAALNAVTDKENIEAIRRDLLQINLKDMQTFESTVTDTNELLKRSKRSAPLIPNIQSTDERLTKTSCLNELELNEIK